MDKCRETGAAHRDKGLIGGCVRMFRILVGELCHDREGVERDGEGSSKGSESEEEGRGERQDQRRKRPEYLDQETQQTPCPGRKMQGHGAKRGNDQRQSGSGHGTCHGHLDRVKERQQDLRKIREIRPHHVGRQI